MFDSIINILGSNILLTAYVTGNNSFPQPLKPEEEKYYLKQLEKGDISAKGVLIERNLRLVAHIVKKYSFSGKDMDDLISIGTIGLIKAIDSFKLDRGTKLATYAAKCIENEILMLIRNNKKTKGEVYLQDPIGIDKEGNEISLMDVLGTDEDSVVDIVEYRIKLKKLYEKIDICLTKREKAVIEMRYGLVDGGIKTQREIAEILGISRSYVSRIEKRSLKKLCKEMQKP